MDNLRWPLVRRTPAAAQVYQLESGANWNALRGLTQSGTISLPAGFTGSFNQTLQQGPEYKEAGGILAGGHCALATAFRAAALQASLPTEARLHARLIPGFPLDQTVNIYWVRDDLLVHHITGQDLYFMSKRYSSPGIFYFYVFKTDQVVNPDGLRRDYDGSLVVPIFDGFGGRGTDPAREKIAKTIRVLFLFGEGSFGINARSTHCETTCAAGS